MKAAKLYQLDRSSIANNWLADGYGDYGRFTALVLSSKHEV
jgi:hypothetical protein